MGAQFELARPTVSDGIEAPNHELFTHREEINTRAHTHAQTERRGETDTDKRRDGERKRDQGWIFRE